MTNTIKRVGWAMVLAVGWLGAGGLAEASCAESTILLAVPGTVIAEPVPVAWVVEPACPVIETGLLLGPSATALAPVGQPIYGVGTTYRLELPLPASGSYWIAAWARDEEGTRLQAEAQQVLVIMPPPVPGEVTGSHGPGSRDPASYTGTDADFLRPAASLTDPRHFASLRFGFSENQQRSESRATGTFFSFISADTVRRVGSTHPDEVRAAQRQPFTLLGEPEPVLLEPVTPGGVGVDVVLAQQDAGFGSFRFPRPGFYSVLCDVIVDFPFGFTSRRTCLLGSFLNPLPTAFALGYTSFARETVTSLSSGSSRGAGGSRLTYFLPAAPPGQRVAQATLRLFVQGAGDLSQIRLSGKPPATSEVVGCVESLPGVNFCQLWLTWDFTAEAQAAAAQGGGLLDLTPDPIPPATFTSPSPTVQVSGSAATYFFSPRVDYPWLHGLSPDNRLVVTFTEGCPQALTVTVTPDKVRPVIPGPSSAIPEPIRSRSTQATVTATVKTCPPPGGSPPASVEVMFTVRPPLLDSLAAAGHAPGHIEPRPLTAFGRLEPSVPGRPKEATCLVTTFNADGMGSCQVPLTYHASEVSGVETIVAEAFGFPKAQALVTVQVPSLIPMAASATGAWRLTGGDTGSHPENHHGTPETVTRIAALATDYFALYSESIGVNDISLVWGGLFDIGGNWAPPHDGHRIGRSVDIDRCAQTLVKQDALDEIAAFYSGRRTVEEALAPPGCSGPPETPRIHYDFP